MNVVVTVLSSSVANAGQHSPPARSRRRSPLQYNGSIAKIQVAGSPQDESVRCANLWSVDLVGRAVLCPPCADQKIGAHGVTRALPANRRRAGLQRLQFYLTRGRCLRILRLVTGIERDQACNQDCYVERPRPCFHYRGPARSPRNGRDVRVANRGQCNKAEI